MTLKKKIIILILSACGVAGIVIFSTNPQQMKGEEVYQISYIHRGEIPEESQQVILQGMEQASNAFNVELTAVNSGNPADAKGQKTLLEKEVENGADAILIEGIDDDGVRSELEKINAVIPVVEVNSRTGDGEDNKIIRVHADDYVIGQELGEAILKRLGPEEGVILIKSGTEYSDVAERYLGVKGIMDASSVPVEEVDAGTDEVSRALMFTNLMTNQSTRHIVAFSSPELEALGKAKQEHPDFNDISIYGTGNTNQIINYLESGIIQVIGVSNEYSIGYLSVRNAVMKLNGEEIEKNQIKYSIIDASQIYKKENQRLLFPFVQ